MDELTHYVFTYFPHLMTPDETAANRVIFWQEKARQLDGEARAKRENITRKHFSTDDPNVLKLVKKGREQFIADVVERILREQRDQVVFNDCPKCQTLARTPTAKQCPKCFHRWHDNVG